MADVKISALPAAGAITGAELVPIVQSGVTSQAPVSSVTAVTYKIFRALLTQIGTAAPTAIILQNTLGGVPVWAYNGVGFYQATLNGAFNQNKMYIICGQTSLNSFTIAYPLVSPNSIGVSVVVAPAASPTPIDGMLFLTPLEILVYP